MNWAPSRVTFLKGLQQESKLPAGCDKEHKFVPKATSVSYIQSEETKLNNNDTKSNKR